MLYSQNIAHFTYYILNMYDYIKIANDQILARHENQYSGCRRIIIILYDSIFLSDITFSPISRM